MKLKLSLFSVLLSFAALATVHNVSVTSNVFNPSSLTINQGDTVIWTNTQGNHNVNGTTSTFGNNPVSFGNSVGSGWTYQFVFNVAGSYDYRCDPHFSFGMTGNIMVMPVAVSAPVAQSFENSGGTWNFVHTPASYNVSGDVWDTVSSLSTINASNGSEFWGMQDLNNGNGGGNFGHTLDFDPVDVSNLPNARVKFDYYTIGFDSTDSLAYAVEFNNGTGWGPLTLLNKDSQMWVTVDIPVPSGSTHVRLRIYGRQNGGSDYAGVDNFKVEGPSIGPGGIPNYDIAQVTTNDANGLADSLNAEVRLHGIVHSIDFDGNAGYSLYMYDNTGGINVFKTTDVSSYTSPAVGDSIRVIGVIAQFRGLTEIIPDSIVLLTSGVTLKQAAVTFAPDESTESEYIKIRGYWVIDASQWPASGSSASVDITNGTDTTTLRIDSDTDIDGSPAPTGPINITGAGGQFDFSAPFDEGYQILPSSLTDIESVPASTIPNYTIASVTTNDANGVADSLNVEMELRGVVYSIDFDGNNGYSLFMYDATGGINVFNFSDVSNYTSPQMGDSISVFGDIAQFSGLTEIFADSIVLWATNIPLVAPTVVTTLNESTESEYIRLNGFNLVNASQWPSAGSSANVDITDGTQTLIMRIDSDTDIDGTTAPVGSFDVIGAGSQFDSSSPYDTGYQVLPRNLNDILLAPPTVPTVNFALNSIIAPESVGSVQIDLLINPVSPTQDTIFLQGTPGVGVTLGDGTIIPIPNPVNGSFRLIVPANEDSASFTIQVIDDALVESNETLFINISSVSAGLSIGTASNFQGIIQDNDSPAPGIPTYDIGDVTSDDANGVADSLTVYCKLHGVVYTDDFDGNNGFSFYIYDNTGGINVFNFNDVSNYVVERGDSIRIVGEIDQFNGLTELVVDSITILDSNIVLKLPAVVADLDATTEGEYIRMNGFTLVTPSQWPSAGSSANVDITDGTVTVIMRIDSDTDIDGTPAPTGAFDVIGAGGQFDSSNPFTSGYQILPRDLNDIIPVVATTPTVSFASGSSFSPESIGNNSVTLNINPVSPNAETIKVFISNGAGITAGDYSTVPNPILDTIIVNVAANATSGSFLVNVIDDAIQENDETITFTIANTTSGLSIGSPTSHAFTIQDNDTPIPFYDIADVTTNDASVIPDSLGVYCKLTGVVFTDDFDGNNGLSFYMYDNTGGINVFNFNDVDNYFVTRGDSLVVVGSIGFFSGLTELIVDSIRVINSGIALKAPQVVTALDETTESEYIRINGYQIVDPTEWPTTVTGSRNVRLFKSTDTIVMRIDSDVNINGTPVPVGPFDVVGVGGQFDASAPHDTGYQIFPRDLDDIIIFVPKLAITEIMPSSNQPSPIDGDWFEVTNYGSDPIDINGFSWDDDSQNAGTHTVTSSYIVNGGESIIFLDAVDPDDSTWLYTWQQASNGLKVIDKSDFGGIGFSSLSSGGDEVNLYDQNGALIQRAAYSGSDVTAGFSLQYDSTGTLIGSSVVGQDGAYTSGTGDVGNPGNMNPVSLNEFMLAEITLYPNPATNLVYITSATNEVKDIEIVSLTGAVVKSFSTSEEKVEINISNMAPGVYVISIELNGARASRKLIVE